MYNSSTRVRGLFNYVGRVNIIMRKQLSQMNCSKCLASRTLLSVIGIYLLTPALITWNILGVHIRFFQSPGNYFYGSRIAPRHLEKDLDVDEVEHVRSAHLN
jgi:hypothetical protein